MPSSLASAKVNELLSRKNSPPGSYRRRLSSTMNSDTCRRRNCAGCKRWACLLAQRKGADHEERSGSNENARARRINEAIIGKEAKYSVDGDT